MNKYFKPGFVLLFFLLSGLSNQAQEKLKADGEMPVLAWIGVPERETTIERFRELKESGININFFFFFFLFVV